MIACPNGKATRSRHFPFEVWTFIKEVGAERQRVGTGSGPE